MRGVPSERRQVRSTHSPASRLPGPDAVTPPTFANNGEDVALLPRTILESGRGRPGKYCRQLRPAADSSRHQSGTPSFQQVCTPGGGEKPGMTHRRLNRGWAYGVGCCHRNGR